MGSVSPDMEMSRLNELLVAEVAKPRWTITSWSTLMALPSRTILILKSSTAGIEVPTV